MTWAEVRADAIRKFGGEPPHRNTEDEIIDAFEAFPSMVTRLIDEIAESRSSTSPPRSCWAVLRKRLAGAQSFRDVTVDGGSERETMVRKAESWLRNCGHIVDRESELEDALFGPFGQLRDYSGDDLLRQRMLGLWRATLEIQEAK